MSAELNGPNVATAPEILALDTLSPDSRARRATSRTYVSDKDPLDEDAGDSLQHFQDDSNGMLGTSKSPEQAAQGSRSGLQHSYIQAETVKRAISMDSSAQAAKLELIKAKTEVSELKTFVENAVSRYYDLEIQEVDLEVESVRRELHQDYISGIKALEETRYAPTPFADACA